MVLLTAIEKIQQPPTRWTDAIPTNVCLFVCLSACLSVCCSLAAWPPATWQPAAWMAAVWQPAACSLAACSLAACSLAACSLTACGLAACWWCGTMLLSYHTTTPHLGMGIHSLEWKSIPITHDLHAGFSISNGHAFKS